MIESGESIVALEILFPLSVWTSTVYILLWPWENPRILLFFPFGTGSIILSLWSSYITFLYIGNYLFVLLLESACKSALSAWILIIIGEHPGVFELYVLFGLLKGFKTLKKPVTYSS